MSENHSHVYVEATVTTAPDTHVNELGTVLTICAICGYVAGAERAS